MNNHTNELIELGQVSADTAGDGGPAFEMGGRMPHPGLQPD